MISAPLIQRRSQWQMPNASDPMAILRKYQTPGTAASFTEAPAMTGQNFRYGQSREIVGSQYGEASSYTPYSSPGGDGTSDQPDAPTAPQAAAPPMPNTAWQAPAENATQRWQRQATESTRAQSTRYYDRKFGQDSRDPYTRMASRRTAPGAPTVFGSSDPRRANPVTFNNSPSGWRPY